MQRLAISYADVDLYQLANCYIRDGGVTKSSVVGIVSRAVFARDATGLVRELSTFDTFVLNVAFIGIPWALPTYISAPYIFPGSDPVIATILTTLGCIFVALTFAMITLAMPRTGADYVFMSRVIHPVVGFCASFNLVMFIVVSCGILTNWITTLAISPALLVVGTITQDQSLVAMANSLVQPQNIIIVGTIFLILNALVMVKGLRATMIVMTALFVVGNVIMVGVLFWLLGTHTNADFMNAFGKFADYNSIITSAHEGGYSPQGPNNLVATVGMIPLLFFSLGFMFMTPYFGAEIKSFKRNALISQVGAVVFTGVVLSILGALAVGVFGYDFLGSISYLSATASSSYPFSVPPYFTLFASLLTTSPAVLWLIGAALVASLFIIIITNVILPVRALFAWSFDRILPTKVSNVSERFHSPVNATVIVSILVVGTLTAYTFGPSWYLTALAGALLAMLVTFCIMSVGAIIFPFRQKDIYNGSAAKMSIGGIPVISIVGTISLIFYLILEYFLVTNSVYGANNPFTFEMTAVVLVILPTIIYSASYYYHKSKGLDISLAFKQIPPE